MTIMLRLPDRPRLPHQCFWPDQCRSAVPPTTSNSPHDGLSSSGGAIGKEGYTASGNQSELTLSWNRSLLRQPVAAVPEQSADGGRCQNQIPDNVAWRGYQQDDGIGRQFRPLAE